MRAVTCHNSDAHACQGGREGYDRRKLGRTSSGSLRKAPNNDAQPQRRPTQASQCPGVRPLGMGQRGHLLRETVQMGGLQHRG